MSEMNPDNLPWLRPLVVFRLRAFRAFSEML